MVDESHPETERYEVEFPVLKAEEVRILDKIGSGTFGVVLHGFSNALGHVAIKVCNKGDEVRKLQEEVRTTLRYGAHPNIVKVFGCYDDPINGISFVLEYMSGGTLEDVVLNRKDLVYCIDHIVSWMYQISSAVTHMHQCNVMHRDLKPANILMNDRFTTLKICDLGEARLLVPNEYYTRETGTPLFMAPEVMNSNNYTDRVDVYSIGMIIWLMCARRYPSFVSQLKTPQALMKAIIDGTRPAWLSIIDELNDIIKTCMAGDPEDRVDAITLRDFAVELVQRYPFGQMFLICVADSKTLREPINIRGDVTGGYANLEDIALTTQRDHILNTPDDGAQGVVDNNNKEEFLETLQPVKHEHKEIIKLELELHQTHSVRGLDWEVKEMESSQDILSDSRTHSLTHITPEPSAMECQQIIRLEREILRALAIGEAEASTEKAVHPSPLDAQRSSDRQFSPPGSLKLPSLSSSDSSRSSRSAEVLRNVDEIDKKPQEEQGDDFGYCTKSQDSHITSNRRFSPLDSLKISACRRTTSSESSLSEKPFLEDSKRVSPPRHSVGSTCSTASLAPTEDMGEVSSKEDRSPVDGLVRHDSSPKLLTSTNDAWYINSTRIDRDFVKSRKSVFEPTQEEQ